MRIDLECEIPRERCRPRGMVKRGGFDGLASNRIHAKRLALDVGARRPYRSIMRVLQESLPARHTAGEPDKPDTRGPKHTRP
jgi:hypothetical protein